MDFILVTHGHGDHLGDSEQLMKKYSKTVFVVIDFISVLFIRVLLNYVVTWNHVVWMEVEW